MSTVSPPWVMRDVSKAPFKANEFLPRVAPTLAPAVHAAEPAGDRILLTLLALGLMLLAFFVVLTSFGSVDARRTRGVVESVQAAFEVSRAQDADLLDARPHGESDRAAVNALRASVADIFANVVVSDAVLLPGADAAQRRVDIDVPLAVFFPAADAVLSSLPLLDKIIAVISAPPPGYRMELVARAKAAPSEPPDAQTRIAVLADTLVARGAAPTALSVGTLRDAAPNAVPMLRFSFLLLADDDDAAARMVAAP